MRLPVMRGTIERRLLVNYRVDPDVLAGLLPRPFRPQQVRGWGMAGICLIRLGGLGPRGWPAALGIRSENAAHRVAVEWDDIRAVGERAPTRRGVFIPRRDTSSRLNALAGGRLFPGTHHRASFRVQETDDRFLVELDSLDGQTQVAVAGRLGRAMPAGSVFATIDEASTFFAAGSLGYSVTSAPGVFDGLELRTSNWQVEALDVDRVESSYFADRARFPAGSVEFDSALLMRGIRHEWHARGTLCQSDFGASKAAQVAAQRSPTAALGLL
jgi:hypothetical protein